MTEQAQSLSVYSARKLIQKSTEHLKKVVKGNFLVRFEDGKDIQMSSTELIFSSYFWDIHRELPWLPLISDHCIVNVLRGKLLNSSSHRIFFEKVFWFIHDTAMERGIPFDVDFVDRINEMVYRKSNELYNFACVELEEHVIGTDVEDYYDLLSYPRIKEALKALRPTEEGIRQAYATVTDVIMNDPEVADNELVVSARTGMVKMSQLMQCIVCRGYVTDIDSKIFPEPSMGSFIRGYEDYYSLLIDTRTAAKSLHFSASLLRTSEYNSRKLQILCQSVQTLHPGDCGSQHYLHFKVQKDDIKRWAGKYFVDEETNKLRELKPDDTQYLGKVLRFRSPLAGCAHPDPHGVCGVCFGAMSVIVPEHTNIGYMLAAALMQILSQSILSIKHIDSSSSTTAAVLNPHQKKFIEVDDTGMNYRFVRALGGKKLTLTISDDQMPTIASLQTMDRMDGVSASHFSDLNMTLIGLEEEFEQQPLDLSNEKRNAFFTREALDYIRTNGWTRSNTGQIVIDFSKWDVRKPFASLPRRHFNNADHAKDIADLIQGSSSKADDNRRRRQDGSTTDYFIDLYNMVVSRLPHVPAVILEHIVYGASIRSGAQDDYRLPRAGTSREMGLSDKTVPRRSMGAAAAFEYHVRELFITTKGFDPAKTSSHPMDVFVLPFEAVQDAKRRGLR